MGRRSSSSNHRGHRRDRASCCRLSCCCMFNVVGGIIILSVLIWYFAFFAKDVQEYKSLANCGDCYCIPEDNEDATTSSSSSSSSSKCPSAVPPPSTYPEESHLNVWKSQTLLNPYRLNCNPYKDNNKDNNNILVCDTEPPLDSDLVDRGETAVCAVHYEEASQLEGVAADSRSATTTDTTETTVDANVSNNATIVTATCKQGTFYRIQTYPSQTDAELAGGKVTHVGHCGVCSTLQDLAVYATVDFVGVTSPGNFCRRQASMSIENGASCYRGLGLTQDCARIWADTSWNTATKCFGACVLDPTIPIFNTNVDSNNNGLSSIVIDNTTNINITNYDDDNDDSNNANKWYDLPVTLRERFYDLVESQPPPPPNGPAPACIMNDCLVCNEQASAAIFDRFAGRNRRRSGLLSTVAYPCGSIPNIVQEPCPITKPLVVTGEDEE